MAGQTVVSRNKKPAAAPVDACRGDSSCGPLPPAVAVPLSPVANPFRGRTGTARSSRLAGVLLAAALLVCGSSRGFFVPGPAGDAPAPRGQQQPQQQLRLRPAYLTDDGAKDEDADDPNAEETEEPTEEKQTFANEEQEEEDGEPKHDDPEDEPDDDGGNEANEEGGKEEPKVRLRSPSGNRQEPQTPQHGGRPNQKIPKILIFTHHKNLLELLPKSNELLGTDPDHHDSNPDDADSHHAAAVVHHAANDDAISDAIADADANPPARFTPDELEELTLAVNVKHSIDVHNRSSAGDGSGPPKVLFWTDEDCLRSLQKTRPALVPYFRAETEGMYKADVCRGTALLEHGGFYLDADLGVRDDLWRDLRPETEFVTARVHKASNWVGRGFFQAILGSSPNSPVLSRYLELFEKHYDGREKVEKGPLGVLLLKTAWDQVRDERGETTVPTELYQELLYHEAGPLNTGPNRGALSPAPTWGKRRACHFVVAGMANDPSLADVVLQAAEGGGSSAPRGIGLRIPALSRIPGSRMCAEPSREGDSTLRVIRAMRWWERA